MLRGEKERGDVRKNRAQRALLRTAPAEERIILKSG